MVDITRQQKTDRYNILVKKDREYVIVGDDETEFEMPTSLKYAKRFARELQKKMRMKNIKIYSEAVQLLSDKEKSIIKKRIRGKCIYKLK